MPRVSVCIATHNRRAYLQEAIASVLAQSFQDVEILVCDDGSQDDTADWMASQTDSRIRYIRHREPIGKSNNMRSGFAAATGDYFIKFDDDDRLTPEFLARTAAILDEQPAIDLVSTDHWIIDPESRRDEAATDRNSRNWGRTDLAEGPIADLIAVTFLHQSLQIGATLFRKGVLDDLGYMRPDLQNCEDNDLLVRFAQAGHQAYYLADRLMDYRVHPEQQSLARAIRYLTDKIAYLDYFHFDDPTIEHTRQQRLIESRLLLGLRLIRTDAIAQGRRLIWQAKAMAYPKAAIGLALSYMPHPIRQMAFQRLPQT
jgi:glycosyltransferase involved in cell wall biosynthesis